MSTPPSQGRPERERAAEHVDVPAQQVDPGNARSRAPIMIGTRKLPSTAGIDGTRKKKTITTPWSVNSLLYVSGWTTSPAGVISSSRISVAAAPPMKKNNVIEIMYRIAIRLWSVVSSHDLTP